MYRPTGRAAVDETAIAPLGSEARDDAAVAIRAVGSDRGMCEIGNAAPKSNVRTTALAMATVRFRGRCAHLVAAAFVLTYILHGLAVERQLSASPLYADGGARGAHKHRHAACTSRIHATEAPRAWTESHSASHAMDPSVRISFRLHDASDERPRPDKFLSVKPYMCGTEQGKAELPPPLSKRNVLGFTTSVATDLKIVHLGDSLGQQFVQGFDATVLGAGYEGNRRVLQEYFYKGNVYSHNCLAVSAPTRGGGASAYWRVTDLIAGFNRRRGESACAKEDLQLKQRVGWSYDQSIRLVGHRYGDPPPPPPPSDSKTVVGGGGAPVGSGGEVYPVGPFDAVIMRIPHGWMDIPDITRERLVEAIELCHASLGVETVVVTTLPLNNNVRDADDWRGIGRINDVVREIARTWNSGDGNGKARGVKRVLVQEFGNFTNQILDTNARSLGYDVEPPSLFSQSGWELSRANAFLDRLPWPPRKWPPSVPMVCAERPSPSNPDGGKDCVRNRISSDGIHWCIETLGPRYAASVACLLGCVYNGGGRGPEGGGEDGEDDVRACERECNDAFMSITPVDERWIGGETTMYSQPRE